MADEPAVRRAQLVRHRLQEQPAAITAAPDSDALGVWASRLAKTAAIVGLSGVLALGSATPAEAAMSGGRMGGSSFSRSSFSSSRGSSSSSRSSSGFSSSRSSGGSRSSGSGRSAGRSSGGGSSSYTHSSTTIIVPGPSYPSTIWFWSPSSSGTYQTPAPAPAATAPAAVMDAPTSGAHSPRRCGFLLPARLVMP